MSNFIGNMGTDTSPTLIERSNERLLSVAWRPDVEAIDAETPNAASFITPWWPGGARAGLLGDAGDVNAHGAIFFDQPDSSHNSGGDSRFLFAGVTRDQFGSPVGSCTVKLMLTATDTLVDTVVSDTAGNFILSSPFFPDTHYILVHKSGSPDIDGVSVNTLTGT